MARPGTVELLATQEFLAGLTARRAPDSALPKKQDIGGGRWRVYCGDGRFDWNEPDGLLLPEDIALNFQAVGDASGITSFEAGVYWRSRWALMLHHDSKQADWPAHPEKHIQFEGGDGPAPFIDWRVPADGDFLRWIEYVAAVLMATLGGTPA